MVLVCERKDKFCKISVRKKDNQLSGKVINIDETDCESKNKLNYSLEIPCYKDKIFSDHEEACGKDAEKLLQAKIIVIEGKTMRFDFKTFGNKLASGFDMFIGLHSRGNRNVETLNKENERL